MQDLGQRRKLEREIDEVLTSKDAGVHSLALQAQEALGARKYDQARKLADEALETHAPPSTLAKFLCEKGGVPSAAQARRIIQGGKVSINGVRARKWDVLLRPGAKVEVQGKVISQ